MSLLPGSDNDAYVQVGVSSARIYLLHYFKKEVQQDLILGDLK